MSAPLNMMRPVTCANATVVNICPARTGRKQVTFRNQGSFPVYIGTTSNVASSGDNCGMKLDSGGLLQFSVFDGDQCDCAFYGIAAGGAVTVVVIA